jgi:hypothetical protein
LPLLLPLLYLVLVVVVAMTRLGMVVVEVGVVTVVDSGGVDIITRNVVIEVMW